MCGGSTETLKFSALLCVEAPQGHLTPLCGGTTGTQSGLLCVEAPQGHSRRAVGVLSDFHDLFMRQYCSSLLLIQLIRSACCERNNSHLGDLMSAHFNVY